MAYSAKNTHPQLKENHTTSTKIVFLVSWFS